MFKIGGAVKGQRGLVITLAVLALSNIGQAATVGQWSSNQSNTVWASGGNFSSIYAAATATGVGHTIETPEAITVDSLKNNTHFIISAPTALPSATAISALRQWVMDGGILLLMVDPGLTMGGSTATSLVNTILSQLGSSMASTSGYPIGSTSSLTSYGTLQGSNPAVVGSAGTLTGRSLTTSQFNPLMGGTGFGPANTGLNNLIRVGGLTASGSPSIGQIYLFGNATIAGNGAIATNSTNRTFFLNLLGQNLGGITNGAGVGPLLPGEEQPEPGTISLMAFGLAGVVWYRKRRGAA